MQFLHWETMQTNRLLVCLILLISCNNLLFVNGDSVSESDECDVNWKMSLGHVSSCHFSGNALVRAFNNKFIVPDYERLFEESMRPGYYHMLTLDGDPLQAFKQRRTLNVFMRIENDAIRARKLNGSCAMIANQPAVRGMALVYEVPEYGYYMLRIDKVDDALLGQVIFYYVDEEEECRSEKFNFTSNWPLSKPLDNGLQNMSHITAELDFTQYLLSSDLPYGDLHCGSRWTRSKQPVFRPYFTENEMILYQIDAFRGAILRFVNVSRTGDSITLREIHSSSEYSPPGFNGLCFQTSLVEDVKNLESQCFENVKDLMFYEGPQRYHQAFYAGNSSRPTFHPCGVKKVENCPVLESNVLVVSEDDEFSKFENVGKLEAVEKAKKLDEMLKKAKAKTDSTRQVAPITPPYPNRLEKEFEFVRELGEGGFGKVFEVVHRWDRQRYALKIALRKNYTSFDKTINEILISSQLHHPAIIKYFGGWMEPVSEVSGEFLKKLGIRVRQRYKWLLMVQMELLDGNIDSIWIEDWDREIDKKLMMRAFVAVVKPLLHIHSKGIVHRDISTTNVFKGGDEIKLGDFGMSSFQADSATIWKRFVESEASGRSGYIAPEVFHNFPVVPENDVYSLGCVLYQLFMSFKGNRDFAAEVTLFSRGDFPDHFVQKYPEIASLVRSMMVFNPFERISLASVLERSEQILAQYEMFDEAQSKVK